MKYRLIRSRRKSVGLKITEEGLVVRAPLYATEAEINKILLENSEWIEKNLRQAEEKNMRQGEVVPLTNDEIRELADRALKYIPERVRLYAPKVGVTYGRVTIRNQRSRWGSCSAKGNLNFNCLLMLMPEEVIDSVVVHELCHRKEMNHSQRFYAEVLKVFPNYRECEKWLKENGDGIMKRMCG